MIALGVLVRFALSAASLGTNDAAAWVRFGDEISHYGLIPTYQVDRDFNHPPLPGYWALLATKIAGEGGSGLSSLIFTNVFRVPAMLADCLGIYLLWLVWRKRLGNTGALVVAALFALSIDAILVSAFHCNTDSIYVALCLLCVYLIEERGATFWGGFALGAAINIKIIPLLLILPLLLSFRRWRDALKFTLGLALWVLPFVPELAVIRGKFIENVLKYNSSLDRWGINFFTTLGQPAYNPNTPLGHFAWAYYFNARYLIVGLIVLWAVVARLRGRWNRYQLIAVTFALFLLFTPGFGVQYTVMVGLLLFAIRPGLAVAYGWTAGVFIGAVYLHWWARGAPRYGIRPFALPIFCDFEGLFPQTAAFIGLVAWLLLAYFVIATVWHGFTTRAGVPVAGLPRGPKARAT